MIFLKKIFKILLILHLLIISGCTDYSKLSKNERLVSYKFLSDETKYYIEKFDNKTESWFRAKCKNPTINFKDCINNTEFT